jgi:hypothetical protein
MDSNWQSDTCNDDACVVRDGQCMWPNSLISPPIIEVDDGWCVVHHVFGDRTCGWSCKDDDYYHHMHIYVFHNQFVCLCLENN